MLNITESFENLEKAKLNVAKWKVIKNESELSSFSIPFWLKANIAEHKTEQKAVLKCSSLEQAKENLKDLRKKFPTDKIIAQEQVDGIEMIVGIKSDIVFGRLLLVGFGGTFTEIVKDVSFRALPIDRREIEQSLKELKFYPMLVTRKKFAIGKFLDLAEKISKLDIKEADFNPVILNEKEAVIVDARIEI